METETLSRSRPCIQLIAAHAFFLRELASMLHRQGWKSQQQLLSPKQLIATIRACHASAGLRAVPATGALQTWLLAEHAARGAPVGAPGWAWCGAEVRPSRRARASTHRPGSQLSRSFLPRPGGHQQRNVQPRCHVCTPLRRHAQCSVLYRHAVTLCGSLAMICVRGEAHQNMAAQQTYILSFIKLSSSPDCTVMLASVQSCLNQ